MNFATVQSALEHYTLAFLISNIIAIICTMIILLSILIDFLLYHKRHTGKKGKRSFVETGTMFIYFFIYYVLIQFQIGRVNLQSKVVMDLFSVFGSILIIAGCCINVMGRFQLKNNWSNQVVIYNDHTHVTTGIYRFIRHPLYASLIGMLIGGSLIYIDYLAFISVIFIFLPMMYYRAKQEENMLSAEFSRYSNYKLNTGMFFLKIFKKW
jgi:protein-S-isoprenylcysteine O-methyltransferase Ste14